ncbi:sulfotransferase [Sphingopyxis sp.]|uniref:tetratricopeptide repeat-containing sulfotransferase family protein n=1 Tax=Sphingopyxis sp. TaxID=1908224 RepID=UPI003D0DD49E
MTADGFGTLEHALANGRALLARDPRGALEQAHEILRADGRNYDALRLRAAALRRLGDAREAERTERLAIENFGRSPVLAAAATALSHGDLKHAEHLLRPHVARNPDEPGALIMLAELDNMMGAYASAETLFRKAATIMPAFAEPRLGIATVLFRLGRPWEAVDELRAIVETYPGNEAATRQLATTLGHLGRFDEAITAYETFLAAAEGSEVARVGYGHMLKTVGRAGDAVAAYRRVLSERPGHGEVWWSLANLKTVRFDASDIGQMEAAITAPGQSADDRAHLHFALGKALEDAGDYQRSFAHYVEGNALVRSLLPHDAEAFTGEVSRAIAALTPELFRAAAGGGHPDPAPIFILGMPRAGSTLIEQILASHSEVEGTAELPYISEIARDLVSETWQPYPELLAGVGGERLAELGQRYIDRARFHRSSDRPFFIDKMPNNWVDIGLIHLIMPNAKIIDARRHPLDCSFSNFKQHFARGQAFSYDLADMGRYYRDYVRLMAHVDQVLPGRVHRVIHEDLIADPGGEIRRLLAALDLPFEENCLRFHENARPVRTASSEQVRRPINRDGVERWRAYEAWLGPLKDALGPVLDAYPAAPQD